MPLPGRRSEVRCHAVTRRAGDCGACAVYMNEAVVNPTRARLWFCVVDEGLWTH